jgi:hypothetical protein
MKIDDKGVCVKCWDELFLNNITDSWNLDLIKILEFEKNILNNNQSEIIIFNNKQFETINLFYKQLEIISEKYFKDSIYTDENKVKKFVFELLVYLTSTFICYNIEMLLRNLLMKYFYDLNVDTNINDNFNNITQKINYLLESNKFLYNLYNVLPEEFVRISVDLFKNYEDKQLFESKSVKEILNSLFNLLTVGDTISIPSDSHFMQILNRDLTDYFDLFIQKLINNWLVVIENIFKFSINQYRINTCILELIKKI